MPTFPSDCTRASSLLSASRTMNALLPFVVSSVTSASPAHADEERNPTAATKIPSPVHLVVFILNALMVLLQIDPGAGTNWQRPWFTIW